MATLKIGTKDLCKHCGRPVEWGEPPLELDENDVDIRPYWKQHNRFWADIDPQGSEVWEIFCDFKNSTGQRHEPSSYCGVHTSSGQPCYNRLKDNPVGVYACGVHIKDEVANMQRLERIAEDRLTNKWRKESEDLVRVELGSRKIHHYPPGSTWLPNTFRERGVLVLPEDVLGKIEELEMEILMLKEEMKNGNAGQG